MINLILKHVITLAIHPKQLSVFMTKLSSKKFCKKSELNVVKKKSLAEIGLLVNIILFVWPNLNPYNNQIGFNFDSTHFYSWSAFIKKYDTDKESIKIYHLNQLSRLFSDFTVIFWEYRKGSSFISHRYSGLMLRSYSNISLYNNCFLPYRPAVVRSSVFKK